MKDIDLVDSVGSSAHRKIKLFATQGDSEVV